ncbi:hypothetical protein QJS66_22085 [Kocuria rhizophila]|nr:hypothetical protein QJS66_22085 [Kocuria rhizophila]
MLTGRWSARWPRPCTGILVPGRLAAALGLVFSGALLLSASVWCGTSTSVCGRRRCWSRPT